MLMFLTDGQPSSGETDLQKILRYVRNWNNGRFTIFSLGFGDNVDFPFLQQISLQNQGFARRIYADSDASLQV